MIGKCVTCKKTKELPYKGKNLCRECNSAYVRQYYRRNKDRLKVKAKERYEKRRQDNAFVESEKKRGRQYWAELRHEAIMAYGGYKCNCPGCNETESLFLSIDHINNDGAEHRRSLGYENNGKGASSATLSWMKKNGYPPGFQVLCMNCNFGKSRNNGICPHEQYHKQTT